MFFANLFTLLVAHVSALPPLIIDDESIANVVSSVSGHSPPFQITDEGSIANMPPPFPENSLPFQITDDTSIANIAPTVPQYAAFPKMPSASVVGAEVPVLDGVIWVEGSNSLPTAPPVPERDVFPKWTSASVVGAEVPIPDGVRRAKGTIAVGDMLFTSESYRKWLSAGRSYLMPPANQWYKDTAGFPVIPYVIDSTLNSAERTVVLNGINQWSGTCVKFVNNTVYKLNNYLKIVKPTVSGQCDSYVGNVYLGSAGQPLNLGPGCYTDNIVAHEIGHAIGLSHEHNRADRDQYLNVYLNNTLSGYKSTFNLDQVTYMSTQNVPYNYLSVMHYFWNVFSTNSSLPTMLPKDPTKQIYLMANNPVSHYDTLLVNRAMNCSALWAKSCVYPPTCMNYGYLSKACTCVCPPGTTGTDCGTKTASSFPVYPANYTNYQCGGNITMATTGISTPLYNSAYPARTAQADCIWWIKKPSTAYSAKVTFKSFNMFRKENGSCYYEFLEVRTKSLYLADARKCATDYYAGSVITSSGDIVLWFQSRVYPGGNTGFTFDVSFM